MKNILYKYKIVALTLLISLGACDKNFEEINVNPNQPPKVPTSALLTSAQKELMDFIWDEWHNGRFGMVYAQYWAQNEYTEESRYQLRDGINNNYWVYYYAGRDADLDGAPNGGGLADLQEIIRLNTESPGEYTRYGDTDNQIAVARIMKAWMFQIITDIWGDVPYSEALQGSKNPSPAYTPQSEIYKDLLKELTEASAQIKTAAPGFPTGDLIYGGKMDKWKKFANSLKLRVAIRMADREPALAARAINEALAAGVFTSNEDNALLKYLTAVPNNNPLNQDRQERTDFAASKPLIDLMTKYQDPRIGVYAEEKVNGGGFVGMPYGVTNAQAGAIKDADVSQPGDAVLAPEAPGIYITYDEVLFIQAEAAQRGFTSGNAASLYNDAIKASMNFWGITNEAAITAYQARVPYDANNWKQSLGEQKWLALYMQGIQGWTEWRRLDFTGVLVMPEAGPLVGTGIPVRVTYPTIEQQLNRSNYDAALSRQGPDMLSTRMWWDAN